MYLLLFFLIISLAGCSKQTKVTKELYTDALKTLNESPPYKTTEVIKGEYSKQAFCNANLYYPIAENLTFRVDGADVLFVEYLVETDQKVKKGTPLASFKIEYDAVALEERELQLKRANESYQTELQTRQTAIADIEKNNIALPEGLDKEISKLKVLKSKLDYEKFKLESEENLSKQAKELEDYKSSLAVTQLFAPMDGIISSINEIANSEIVKPDFVLATMHSEDTVLLEAADEAGILRYHMAVTIEVGNAEGKSTLNGIVISSPNILSDGLSVGTAYVQILDAPDDITWSNNITVHAKPVNIENVLLVDTAAVFFNNKSPYVTILEDGKLHKRYFTAGGNNADYYWILQGLKEGQTVIMK